tara:strand:+ start:834 stop:1055 length:222 start_codon:yes stop_codon:yes gene_type:complete
MEHLYIAFITTIIFFICKQILNRRTTIPDFNKQLIRDCVLLFIIVSASSYGIKYYNMSEEVVKTEIFTSMPGF